MAVSVTTTMLARKMFAPRSAVKDSSSALPSPIYLTFHPLLTTEVGMTLIKCIAIDTWGIHPSGDQDGKLKMTIHI